MLRFITKAQITWFGVKDEFRKFVGDESGATAIEYGLIAAGITVAIIAAVFALGDEIANFFGDIQTELENAGS